MFTSGSRYLPGCRFSLRLSASLALLIFALCVSTSITAAPVTTVYIVRHAEKLLEGKDPALSEAGVARAQTLAHVLKDAGIDAVYVTDYERTRQTGMPVANAVGVSAQTYAAGDAMGLAKMLTEQHAGQQVLVVGHSNTIGRIAAALGGEGLGDLNEDQYDRLLVVHHWGDDAQLEILRYGAMTP